MRSATTPFCVFDSARQIIKAGPDGALLSWLAHGPYILENLEEPLGNLAADSLLDFFLEEIAHGLSNVGRNAIECVDT